MRPTITSRNFDSKERLAACVLYKHLNVYRRNALHGFVNDLKFGIVVDLVPDHLSGLLTIRCHGFVNSY